MPEACKTRRPCLWRCLLLAFPLIAGQAAFAADDAVERQQLALLLRQLDMLDRTAARGVSVDLPKASNHFDYERLHDDIERVRSGIRDYLSPQRAQPRDLTQVTGSYRRERIAAEKEP